MTNTTPRGRLCPMHKTTKRPNATPKRFPRGSRLQSRPFYTTVLLLSVLTAYSFLSHTTFAQSVSNRAADPELLFKRSSSTVETPECSQVHDAVDKCAFVRKYCNDDDAGLVHYIELYYCSFGNARPVAFTALVLWLGLLFTTIGIAASDFFSVNLSTIATVLGLSESLAGVTFLAFGNGSPDVFSTFAAMGSNSASMAVGELIGAASFITGVVAGSMALVREFRVDRKSYTRDICFFILAVVFTMIFLADGHLHLWECWVMIGYYGVYVVTVVTWHWYSTRRKARQRREGEARSHVYAALGHSGDELAGEPYRDDPDDAGSGPGTAHATPPDISLLEAGPRIEVDGTPQRAGSDTSSEDHDRMVAAEVASSMRVLRGRGVRRNTMTPIRPSLVGALEFRSALAQLQREGNLQLSTIPGRSYSDYHVHRRRQTTATIAESARSDGQLDPNTGERAPIRNRALSSGDVPVGVPAHPDLHIPRRNGSEPTLSVPGSAASGTRASSPSPSYTVGGNLAAPPVGPSGTTHDAPPEDQKGQLLTPELRLQIPSSRRSSYSDRSSPNTPFPLYSDSPALLTPNYQNDPIEFVSPGGVSPSTVAPGSASRETPFADLQLTVDAPSRPVRWWPYAVLPAPHVLWATLFPTLQGWKEKTAWDKFVSAISVPSIFLLVVTLPVVDSETTDGESSILEVLNDHTDHYHHDHQVVGHMAPPISIEYSAIEPERESEWERYRRHTITSRGNGHVGLATTPSTAHAADGDTLAASQFSLGPPAIVAKPASDFHSSSSVKNDCTGWNRWLVALQLFTGPQFAVLVLWANTLEDWENPHKALIRMVLYALLASLILLGVLVVFTSEDRPPRYHYMLCFMGFIISIAWISTIAGEVVGVLKTVGVILNISEALLGLTIFAAGNSVGDLVADITVARLGYPVMALSACFGGPMLNILLGIGIGGAMMTIQKANKKHRKNPSHPIKYKPYRIQVGGTLMISAITLLVTLVGLLIVVPMNKWILSRKIGWGLITLWAVSTIVNVIVELTGAWGEMA
ncbi:related to sodium-calcium exchangers [Fusarium fujikuroi IMI 58289]|uniref:Related to sodium-calcium exchangers n=1 Tax=Gibberella fujikuroi (strain CBS 195.34 / IMI 58289 / NRRL A-6831) TaxID=1279085 RepID=S0DTK7_GIBF5|nr:related to sodium-calcium exchangers [Fusarium fujikuroi IMI 58289]CCT65760.1 related to sodium-calcium exchangers [Fusarium fujikuroi IMI 58289]SCN78534.1 related to sodium-calcium exchangers [Fusarium fujikuroi]SCO33716.1 related to sodium-calcium exchangers [Fusarium fujikuroi]SCV26342.1 related to sodium-calcium exchangers [Fusarium fujikuroi]